MKYRILASGIKRALKTFPAVVITGPRQSGKTTLLKSLLGKTHKYYSLEDPDLRMRIKDDPRTFLMQCGKRIILDEIQYVPELLPYIKSEIDKMRTPGRWVMTGSQNFVLMKQISESLAGRAAVLSLLPFSLAERQNQGKLSVSWEKLLKKSFKVKRKTADVNLAEIILRGSYPEIASKKAVDKNLWCGSYIATYLERDIRNLSQVGDLGQFERFLRLCAVRTGQILNTSSLARDIGISVPTVKRWLTFLETGYQIFLLYPYYRNIGKRLVKSPKIYFNDTALACYLMGINDTKTLMNSPYFPHIFETLIVTDFWKRFHHFGRMPSIYYLRTRDGLEVDIVLEINQKLHLFEIKSSATITPRHADSVAKAKRDLDVFAQSAGIISRASGHFAVKKDIYNFCWRDILLR